MGTDSRVDKKAVAVFLLTWSQPIVDKHKNRSKSCGVRRVMAGQTPMGDPLFQLPSRWSAPDEPGKPTTMQRTRAFLNLAWAAPTLLMMANCQPGDFPDVGASCPQLSSN